MAQTNNISTNLSTNFSTNLIAMTSDRSGQPASVIQRAWRRYRCHFCLSFHHQQLIREESAWKIQQRWWRKRGYTWRLEHRNYVTYAPLWEAAWKIQQAWWTSRESLFYAEHDAAWTIQNAWWQCQGYSREEAERWIAALAIQDWWRWCLGFGACGAGYEHLRNWDPTSGDDDEDSPLYGDIHYMRYVGGHHREEDGHFDKRSPHMFE